MNNNSSLRIVFMGTPDFSVPALKTLIESHHEVIAVYSQPPRPSGRGHKITKSPIQLIAEENNIPVFTPVSLRDQEEQNIFSNLKADVAIVAAYGLILPKKILELPTHGCFNIHASLLPHWRGAAPIQRAIQNGDTVSGITLMKMDSGLDTGDMLAKVTVEITPQTTGESLHDTLSLLGAKMILPLLDSMDQLTPESQDDSKATYAKKLSKSESQLNFTKSAQELDLQIRAFTPWPGSFFKWKDRTIKVLKARCDSQDHGDKSGVVKLTRDKLYVTCKTGLLELEQVQIQGKKPMDIKSFLNGYGIKDGEVL